jgi:hypothetical protein
MKVAITGSRNWTRDETIYDALAGLPQGSLVILGDCPTGADRIALDACEILEIAHVVEKAEWAMHGRAAGPKRNGKMLDHEPHEVWWFHESLRASKGTKNCVKQARDRGIPTRGWGNE